MTIKYNGNTLLLGFLIIALLAGIFLSSMLINGIHTTHIQKAHQEHLQARLLAESCAHIAQKNITENIPPIPDEFDFDAQHYCFIEKAEQKQNQWHIQTIGQTKNTTAHLHILVNEKGDILEWAE